MNSSCRAKAAFMILIMPRRPTMSPEDLEWAKRLLDDGMPYALVAEAISLDGRPVDRQTVARNLPGYKNHSEWLPVWQQILSTPRLLAIHYECNGSGRAGSAGR